MLGAFVERHDDVRAQADLRFHGAFRSEKVRRSVQMRTKRHAFFGHLAEIVQTEDLETAGVGEYGARPCHKAMQSAQLAYLCYSRPQVKMVGIAEKNLDSKFLQDVLRNALHRRHSSNRHEHGSFDYAVRCSHPPQTGRSGGGFDFKGE